MKARTLAISLSLCTLMLCGMAQAGSVNSLGTVNLRYLNTSPAGFATIQRPGYTNTQTVWAGQYNLQLDPSYVPADPADESNLLYAAADSNFTIGTFCADVREGAPQVPPDTFVAYDIVMPEDGPIGNGNVAMTDDKADALRRLFAAHEGIERTNEDATAFALCVWEIVFETDPTYDVSSGAGEFYATATTTTNWVPTNARDIANDWLVGVQSGNVPDIALRLLASDGWQDFAIVVPGVGSMPPAVPEPITMLGLLMGVGGIAGYIRKRKTA